MSTPAPVVPTPGQSIGTVIKNFFSKLGHELPIVGNKILQILGIAEKEIETNAPALNATIAEIFGPAASLSAAGIETIMKSSISHATVVATALQAGGLNPTLDEAAAVAVAGIIHGTGVTATAATTPSAPAPTS